VSALNSSRGSRETIQQLKIPTSLALSRGRKKTTSWWGSVEDVGGCSSPGGAWKWARWAGTRKDSKYNLGRNQYKREDHGTSSGARGP